MPSTNELSRREWREWGRRSKKLMIRLLSKTMDLAKEFRVCEDETAKAFTATMNSGFQGPQRGLKETRRLVVTEVVDIDEDDCLSLFKG